MLGARLLQLIQAHAGSLTNEVIMDLRTNERTPSFGRMSLSNLESRIGALFSNLGRWIGDSDESAVRVEYEDMGRRRFREGVPVSELVWVLLLTKRHLRRYIRDHGLVDFVGDTQPKLAGLYAEGRLEIESHTGLTVPASAVVRDGDKAQAWKVAGNKLQKVTLAIADKDQRSGDYVLKSGLAEGDQVIRYPSAMLKEGQTVQAAGPAKSSMVATDLRQ